MLNLLFLATASLSFACQSLGGGGNDGFNPGGDKPNGWIFSKFLPASSEQAKEYRRKLALKIKEVLEESQNQSQTDEEKAKENKE